MPIAIIRPINPPGEQALVEIITIGPASPPERPHPGPTPPGPVDPGYSPPWAQVPDPDRPHPSHPIVLPGDPGWGEIPGFGGPGGGPPIGPGHPDYPTRPHPVAHVKALVYPAPTPPEGTPPTPPPAGLPAGTTEVLMVMGPQGKKARGWIEPYVEHHPAG